ncbi:MAG: phosphoglycerate kinase [Thaumarchaeota archaeon S13]|nr:MAG: phosphoglycerate kinase [Thaumarchaeota archaeon S13]RNJ73914.1 MAG: phosphoglycerate kinase [Thaumarchaeota archaeon S14]
MDDLDLHGRTVFLRVDLNCPLDPQTGEIAGAGRIEEAAETVRALEGARVVIASHQGRVGNSDYAGTAAHARVMSGILGREISHVQDVIGEAAAAAIPKMADGDVLMLDNLRLCAEENYEFPPEEAARTVMVRRLAGLFEACVLDSFPTAHRAHPSLVGMPQALPACAGRLVEREVGRLGEIMSVAKAPHVLVLGGAKVRDRLEAISMLVEGHRADHVLLTGMVASVFLRAQGRLAGELGMRGEAELVARAHALIGEHPGTFMTPVDVAVNGPSGRTEVDVREIPAGSPVLDIGRKTVEHYARTISGAGTVFMSGPAGAFEREGYGEGTRELLGAVCDSMATTVVSGGHLSTALRRHGMEGKVDHVSTAGGALVQYMAGRRLPMMAALEEAATRGAGALAK